jgi:hypothetical protein
MSVFPQLYIIILTEHHLSATFRPAYIVESGWDILVRKRNQSHPLARDDGAVNNDEHNRRNETGFITVEKTLLKRPFVPKGLGPTTVFSTVIKPAWPRPACTLTKASPSPPCPVASLARGIVIQVPSKSFSAARKNRHLQNLSHPACAPRPPSCAPAHAPPSSHRRLQCPSASCTCTRAMHSRNGTFESSARCQTAHPRNDAVLGVAPVLRLLAPSPPAVAPPR